MRLLVSIFFIIVIIAIPVMAESASVHKKVPLSVAVPLLQSIEGYALHMGTGERKVHVFIDPLCPHSQNLLELISENKKALSRNSYSFYLYTLQRLHSEKVVSAIYDSAAPLTTMLDVMVHKKKIDLTLNPSDENSLKVEAITEVAKKLDVYKRPYLIFIKKPKTKRGQ